MTRKRYEAPTMAVHRLRELTLLAGSCHCGCPKSDVYAGGCACNNGRGCPGCGADHGGGIVGNNFTRKVSSVEDVELEYE